MKPILQYCVVHQQYDDCEFNELKGTDELRQYAALLRRNEALKKVAEERHIDIN